MTMICPPMNFMQGAAGARGLAGFGCYCRWGLGVGIYGGGLDGWGLVVGCWGVGFVV
jgi:hypothetical protein